MLVFGVALLIGIILEVSTFRVRSSAAIQVLPMLTVGMYAIWSMRHERPRWRVILTVLIAMFAAGVLAMIASLMVWKIVGGSGIY